MTHNDGATIPREQSFENALTQEGVQQAYDSLSIGIDVQQYPYNSADEYLLQTQFGLVDDEHDQYIVDQSAQSDEPTESAPRPDLRPPRGERYQTLSGEVITHKYSADGELQAISQENPDGSALRLVKRGDEWMYATRDSKDGEWTEQGIASNVFATESGAYAFKMEDGLHFKLIDGTSMVCANDGSMVVTNGDGQVTQVRHPDGSARYFKYENGELVRVMQTFPDSQLDEHGRPRADEFWEKDDASGTWHRSADGMPAANVRVDSDGNFHFIYTNPDGTQVKHVDHPDGTWEDSAPPSTANPNIGFTEY